MINRRLQIKQWLTQVLEDNLQDISYRAFIFGSQANKTELSRSDIDVGILSENSIPAVNFVRISNAIEDLPMLHKIDLVDFTNVDERFKTVAMKNVEWL
jgi:predicted nucleotidyltransferase